MNDLISRSALLTKYDKLHEGPPGGARKLIEAAPAVDAVEVIKSNDEIERAIYILNFYRNAYHAEPSGTVKYAVADAINTILPMFARFLERKDNV